MADVTVTQEAREAAADFAMRHFCFTESGANQRRRGKLDHDPLVQAFAKAIAAERERCAGIADAAAKEAGRVGELHPEDSESRARLFARSREAHAIATAIRGSENDG